MSKDYTNTNLLEDFTCSCMKKKIFCFDEADEVLRKIEGNVSSKMKLNLNAIESLIHLVLSDWTGYGNSELDVEKQATKLRAEIGYCRYHLKIEEKKVANK